MYNSGYPKLELCSRDRLWSQAHPSSKVRKWGGPKIYPDFIVTLSPPKSAQTRLPSMLLFSSYGARRDGELLEM